MVIQLIRDGDRVSELRNCGRFQGVFSPINLNGSLFSTTTAQYYIDHTFRAGKT